MAKKNSSPPDSAATSITTERAARLYKLVNLLGQGPQTRGGLMRRLRLGIRGFYRDLEVLRAVGIVVDLARGKYTLTANVTEARERLPFPDPGINLGEARLLAKGRSKAHKKIKDQIDRIVS